MALTFLTTGNIWGEEIPKDTIKVVDVEEILIIASPKENRKLRELPTASTLLSHCLLYTSDAADDLLCVDLGVRRIIKKKKTKASWWSPRLIWQASMSRTELASISEGC